MLFSQIIVILYIKSTDNFVTIFFNFGLIYIQIYYLNEFVYRLLKLLNVRSTDFANPKHASMQTTFTSFDKGLLLKIHCYAIIY